MQVSICTVRNLPGQRVEIHAAFFKGLVAHQVEQVVELEVWSVIWAGKLCIIIAGPKFIAELQRVRTLHPAHHVAPVVVVLDKCGRAPGPLMPVSTPVIPMSGT